MSEAVWLAHDFLSLRFVTDGCTCKDKTANPPSAHWVPTGVWSPSRSCVPAPNGLLILYRLRNTFGDADLPCSCGGAEETRTFFFPQYVHMLLKKKNPFQKTSTEVFMAARACLPGQCDRLSTQETQHDRHLPVTGPSSRGPASDSIGSLCLWMCVTKG